MAILKSIFEAGGGDVIILFGGGEAVRLNHPEEATAEDTGDARAASGGRKITDISASSSGSGLAVASEGGDVFVADLSRNDKIKFWQKVSTTDSKEQRGESRETLRQISFSK